MKKEKPIFSPKILRQEFERIYGKPPSACEMEQFLKNRKKFYWNSKKEESEE